MNIAVVCVAYFSHTNHLMKREQVRAMMLEQTIRALKFEIWNYEENKSVQQTTDQ